MLENEDDSNPNEIEENRPEPTSEKIEIEMPSAPSDDEDYGDYSEKVRKRIGKEVAKRRSAERREKDAVARAEHAERAANGSEQQKAYAEAQWLRTQEHALVGARTQAEMFYRRARETGNVDEEIKANNILAKVASDEKALAMWKANNSPRLAPYLSENIEPQNTRPNYERNFHQQPQQHQQQPTLTTEASRWVEDNEWYDPASSGHDRVAALAARAISEDLENEGYAADDPEHYRELDKRLRQEFPTKFARRRSSPVATSSRGVSPSSGLPPRRVKLTQGQVEFAKRHNIPLERYAREIGDK